MPSCKGAKLLDGKVLKANVGAKELDDWVAGFWKTYHYSL